MTKLTPHALIVDVRKLIAKEEHWCQSHDAVDRDGNSVAPWSPDAISYCLYGALQHCMYGKEGAISASHHLSYQAATDAITRQTNLPVAAFNDGSSHAKVMAALDSIIDGGTLMVKEDYDEIDQELCAMMIRLDQIIPQIQDGMSGMMNITNGLDDARAALSEAESLFFRKINGYRPGTRE